MQGPAVHPAFAQHRLKLLAQGHLDWVFGGQQVPVRDRLLALHRGSQGRGCLLEDVGAHVLHDGAHDDHTEEKRQVSITGNLQVSARCQTF